MKKMVTYRILQWQTYMELHLQTNNNRIATYKRIATQMVLHLQLSKQPVAREIKLENQFRNNTGSEKSSSLGWGCEGIGSFFLPLCSVFKRGDDR